MQITDLKRFHWKVGDGMDVNGGEIVANIAVEMVDKTHQLIHYANHQGRIFFTTPVVVDEQVIKANQGTIPEPAEMTIRSQPSTRKR